MKSLYSLFIFFLFSLTSFAQINGMFNYGQDGHVYFYLVNNTRFHVPVTVIARNTQKNQSHRESATVWSGNTFFFGPNYNWAWEKGETMTVIDGNGQSTKWVCPYTDPDVINMNGGYSSNNNGYNNLQGSRGNSSKQVIPCYACRGNGLCQVCNGTGTQYAYGTKRVCPLCQGKGKCTQCGGKGGTANPYNNSGVASNKNNSNNGYKTCQQCGARYSGYHTCKSKVGSQSSGNSSNKSNNSIDIKVTFKDEVAVFKFQKKGNYLYSYRDGEEVSHTEITENTLMEWKDAYVILIDKELNVYLTVNKENCTWNSSGRISREDLKKFDILHKILYGK